MKTREITTAKVRWERQEITITDEELIIMSTSSIYYFNALLLFQNNIFKLYFHS